MSAPIPLRRDFGASHLRGLAKKTKDGPQARRLLALAAIYDGATRTEAAKIGGVGLQIIRDWVLHFNERGPDGLLNGKSPGQPSKLNDVQRQAIMGRLSKRTLARKLSDEGLNFTEILEQLRRDLAVRYLDDRKLHVSKIAWLLGFHEVSAFTHAFKRWTGKTPSQIRTTAAS